MKRVLLGFSGGIDSCASVVALRNEGYEVTVLTLDTVGDQAMVEHARHMAELLDVELRVADVREQFKARIIDYFVQEYMNGRTPAPCTLCNPLIKWHTLYETAMRDRFDYISTGHYVQVKEHDGRLYVARAVDPSKDQSYYLWALPQRILRKTITPMGTKLKEDVRAANGIGARQRESMGVCFLRGASYGDFLRQYLAQAGSDEIEGGDTVDKNRVVIGHHEGYPFYTIGQKRDAGLRGGEVVVGIDVARNRLVAGHDSDLYHKNLILGGTVVVDLNEVTHSDRVQVMVRGLGRNPEGYARVRAIDGGLHIELSSAAWAAALGQPVVMYIDDRVVGGGFLERYF